VAEAPWPTKTHSSLQFRANALQNARRTVRLQHIYMTYSAMNECTYMSVYLSFYLYLYLSVNLSVCLSIYLSIYLSFCLFVCLSVYLPVCLSVYPPVCPSVYLFLCMYVFLSVCLSVYLSVCLSVYLSVCLSSKFGKHRFWSVDIWLFRLLRVFSTSTDYCSPPFFHQHFQCWVLTTQTHIQHVEITLQ
jgi:hypothetical protein